MIEIPATTLAIETFEKRRDADLWAIGDALLEECGPPDLTKSGKEILEAAAAYLASNGRPQSIKWLQMVHKVSHRYPPGERRDVGWDIHSVVDDPAFLDQIIAQWGDIKSLMPLTAKNVKKLLNTKKRLAKFRAAHQALTKAQKILAEKCAERLRAQGYTEVNYYG